MNDQSLVPGNVSAVARRPVRITRPILVALALGGLLGGTATYYATSSRGVPALVQGTVRGIAEGRNGEMTAIAFRFDDHEYVTSGEGESVAIVADVPWTDAAGEDQGNTRPACLAPGSYGKRMELGVLDVRGEGSWATQLVVSVHCLS